MIAEIYIYSILILFMVCFPLIIVKITGTQKKQGVDRCMEIRVGGVRGRDRRTEVWENRIG